MWTCRSSAENISPNCIFAPGENENADNVFLFESMIGREHPLRLSLTLGLNDACPMYTQEADISKPLSGLFQDTLQPSLHSAIQFIAPRNVSIGQVEITIEHLNCAAQLFGLVLFFVFFLFISFKIMEAMIFGKIRQQERDALQERLVMTILRSLLGLFVLDIDTDDRLTWTAFCAIIVFLQGQSTLCRTRIDYLRLRNTQSNNSVEDESQLTWQYLKLMTVLVGILSANIKLMMEFLVPMVTTCPSTLLLLTFEVATAVIKTFHTIVKGTLNKADDILGLEDLFYFEISCEIVVLIINMFHLVCIWALNGVSFALVDAVIILNMRTTVVELRELVSSLLKHYSAKRKIDVFSNCQITFQDNSSCPICLQLMGPKNVIKLPCNHYFHKKCMQRWMEVGPTKVCSCPMCRQVILTDA